MTQRSDDTSHSDGVTDESDSTSSSTTPWSSSTARGSVVAVAVASGIAGAFAGCNPVGSPLADHLLTAALAAAVAFAAASASGLALALAAAIIVAAGGSWELHVVGLLLLVATAVVERYHRPLPVARALIGAAIVQAALRLPWTSPTRGSAAVALVVMATISISGLRHAPARVRKPIVLTMFGVAALVFAATLVSAVSVLHSRTSLQSGEKATRAGVDAARAGDQTRAASNFAEAERQFDDARGELDSWMTLPGRQLPLVGPQLRTLETVASIGADTVPIARSAAKEIDPDRLRLVGGRLDLATLASYRPIFTRLATQTRVVRAQLAGLPRTWLVPYLDTQLRHFETTVARAEESAQTADEAVAVAPTLLGAKGVRTYLVAFVTPAESRGSGGLMANYGVLTATNGRLHLGKVGRGPTLDRLGLPTKTLTGPADYLARYAKFEPAQTWENVTMSPDFPSVANVMAQLFPQSGGPAIDGVIMLDPFAIARLISLSGPVNVPGLPTITAENAVTFLFHDEYSIISDPAVRDDLLSDVARAVFDHLTTGTSARPARIAQVLSPVIATHNLAMWFRDAPSQQFARRINADAALPPARGDAFGVIVQNAGGNKIDYYLHRSIKYSASVAPATGHETARASVVLRNDSPAGGLPLYAIGNSVGQPTGTNVLYLSLYSPLALQHATLDGKPFALLPERELGRNVYSAFVDIPPGGTRTINVDLGGTVNLSTGNYHFDYIPQVLPNADHVDWNVGFGDGRIVTATGHAPSPIIVVKKANSASVTRSTTGGPWSVDLKLRR